MQNPADPPSSPAWTAGQVARDLGISESTLRTWHRRYGLSPPGTRPGRYRRYHAEDIARLRRMLELVKAGMLASEAAQVAQGLGAGPVPLARDQSDLDDAVRSLDSARCGSLLDALLRRRGVVDAWELACCPALLAVDAEPGNDPALIAREHVLSWALLGALHRIPQPPAVPGAALVLLACTKNEQHTLPLTVLAAALAEAGRPTRMMGAATPGPSIERAVLETQPAAVVLWAQRAETADPGALRTLSGYRVQPVAAGPGWDGRRLPGARRVTTLREALTVLAGPAGRTSPRRPPASRRPPLG